MKMLAWNIKFSVQMFWFSMKTFHHRTFRNALIVLFVISTPLAKTATSTAVGSNLDVKGISNVSPASIESPATEGLSTFEPAKRFVFENNRATALSLPPLAMLGPNAKLSAIFPMIGLIAAVIVTQLLRRRRIAQLRSSSSTGQ